MQKTATSKSSPAIRRLQ